MINVARAAFNFGILIQSKCRMRKQILALSNMGEKFNLTWHTFSSHGKELFKHLMESQEFTDVTLVSDDQHEYRVHKFILSACSNVFKKILTSNPLNTSIYLRGIHHKELESILQFIYLGEVTFYHERMNEFLNVAKNLDIKEIGKNVVNEEEEAGDTENSLHSDGNHVKDEPILEKTASQVLRNSSSSVLTDHKKPIRYPCQLCDFRATHSNSLRRHIMSKHEGIKYPCQQCDYKATQTCHLQTHIKSIHNGIKYSCQRCDYQSTNLNNLQNHIKNIHEGITYPCQQCDYETTNSRSLQRHVKARH